MYVCMYVYVRYVCPWQKILSIGLYLLLAISKTKSVSKSNAFFSHVIKKILKIIKRMIDTVTKSMSIVKRIFLFPLRRPCYFVLAKSPEN